MPARCGAPPGVRCSAPAATIASASSRIPSHSSVRPLPGSLSDVGLSRAVQCAQFNGIPRVVEGDQTRVRRQRRWSVGPHPVPVPAGTDSVQGRGDGGPVLARNRDGGQPGDQGPVGPVAQVAQQRHDVVGVTDRGQPRMTGVPLPHHDGAAAGGPRRSREVGRDLAPDERVRAGDLEQVSPGCDPGDGRAHLRRWRPARRSVPGRQNAPGRLSVPGLRRRGTPAPAGRAFRPGRTTGPAAPT